MSRSREKEPFAVYKGRGGIMTRATVVPGRPLDEVPVDGEGEVDISGVAGEITRANKTRHPPDSVPFRRHYRR